MKIFLKVVLSIYVFLYRLTGGAIKIPFISHSD
jgi:hypothetical protein